MGLVLVLGFVVAIAFWCRLWSPVSLGGFVVVCLFGLLFLVCSLFVCRFRSFWVWLCGFDWVLGLFYG